MATMSRRNGMVLGANFNQFRHRRSLSLSAASPPPGYLLQIEMSRRIAAFANVWAAAAAISLVVQQVHNSYSVFVRLLGAISTIRISLGGRPQWHRSPTRNNTESSIICWPAHIVN